MIYMGKLNPLAVIDSGFDFDFSRFVSKGAKNLSSVVTDEKVHVYKWRDQNGVTQFSSEPPPSAVAAEQIVLNPNSNVIQAVKLAEKEEDSKPVAKTESANPYSVKGMKKVMEDAKGVEDVLQKRHAEQQKVLDDL
jgi:hypothetical protein